jgi:hypothetical protein
MSAELIIALVGLLGLTASNVARWLGYFARINKGARFFGFKRREAIDLILVTSDNQQGDRYRRHLTSYDTLRAATRIAERIGELRLGKTTNLRVSERLDDPPIRDLVVLGGSDAPKNRVAKVFLDEFNEAHPQWRISRPNPPDDSRKLVVGDDEWEWRGWSDAEDAVNTDIAIIVAWHNPFASERRRGIYCAGFTAAGTAAATNYLLSDLSRDGRKRSLGWKRLNPFLSPDFVSVVEFSFSGEQALPRGEVLFQPLDTPLVPGRHGRLSVEKSMSLPGNSRDPQVVREPVSTHHRI